MLVTWVQEAYQLSQRRARRVFATVHSSIRYRSVRPPQESLRARLHELASIRTSYGYRGPMCCTVGRAGRRTT